MGTKDTNIAMSPGTIIKMEKADQEFGDQGLQRMNSVTLGRPGMTAMPNDRIKERTEATIPYNLTAWREKAR